MKKIRVLHITSVHRPTDTRIFYKECISLSDYFEVALYAPKPQLTSKLIKHYPIPFFQNKWKRWFLVLPLLFIKIITGKKASVYHLHDPELLPLGLILSFMGHKVIYDVHELVSEDIKNKKLLFRIFLSKIYNRFEIIATRKIIFVFAEDSYIQSYPIPPTNFAFIRNYPDLKISEKFKSTTRHSRVLLYIGNLTGARGLKQMICLLNYLKEQNEIFNLCCIGNSNKSLKIYLNKIEEYKNVSSQVEFKGYLPLPEALSYSTVCLAGMALYDDLPNHKYSLSTKMLEYMSLGIPVITSDFPLYKNIIEKHNCGFCIPPDNIQQLANAVLYLYNNPDIAGTMSLNGLNAAAGFYNWDSEKNQLLELYNKLLQ